MTGLLTLSLLLAPIPAIADEELVDPTPAPVETATPTPSPTAPDPSPTDPPPETPSPTPTPVTPPPEPPPDETLDETSDEAAPEADGPVVDPTRPVLPVSPIEPIEPGASRYAQASAYDRAVAVSRAAYPAGARVALVASGTTFWDAVAAAGIAGALNAPVLLVAAANVPAAVAAELSRLAPTTIVIVGSPATVSAGVETQLRSITADVRRVDGGSDYGTSRLALTMLPTDVDAVYLAGSSVVGGPASVVDIALAAGTASGTGGGVLLVDGTAPAVDPDTVAALTRVGAANVIIIGATNTVTTQYEQSLAAAGFAVRRAGHATPDRRAVQAAGLRAVPPQRMFVAHTAVMTDIMVAAVAAGGTEQPVGYAYYACVPDTTSAYLAGHGAKVAAVGGTSWLAPPVESNGSCSGEKPKRDALLTDAIRRIASQYGGIYYVSVRELSGAAEIYSFNASTQVEPASMMKLYAAWAALAHVDVGLASYYKVLPGGMYLIDCVAVMIHASDNECHNDIVHWIGTTGLNRMIREAGFTGTSYGNVGSGPVLYAGNRTTTHDLTRFAQRLRAGALLSPANTNLLLGLMGKQVFRSRLASGIPPGVGQQSKPGSLWIGSGLLQADTGIIYGKRSVVALSMVVTGGVDRAALRAIARLVYSHYNGSFGAAAVYPAQQMATKYATTMRASPGGRAVGTIPGGAMLEVTDAHRKWYKVWWRGALVWVDFRSLRDR
ncbi:serine hydrolase [Microbacterium immunditiarum]|uniref:Beta-lactamase class A n=1 Tax=Microbacterium immunditiarum TaxID=337480 RepID=A0A7Y9GR11_9MICO|nr:serine hydrolase [Microbacterium immunditiarum]NYE21016.1 beta-lactamase class A [Microbacterium immunditiarum]